MPRNVRNFWITADVDGRPTKIVGGPVKKDGGFDMTIQYREEGTIAHKTVDVSGRCLGDGTLKLWVTHDNKKLCEITSKR